MGGSGFATEWLRRDKWVGSVALCLRVSVVQIAPKLTVIAVLFWRVGLQPLAEETEDSRDQIDGDDHQDDDEQTPRHGARVAGEC